MDPGQNHRLAEHILYFAVLNLEFQLFEALLEGAEYRVLNYAHVSRCQSLIGVAQLAQLCLVDPVFDLTLKL